MRCRWNGVWKSRTGESIGIRYDLAGLGSRFLAVVLDLAIQLTIGVALVVALSLLARTFTPLADTFGTAAFLTKTGRAIVGAVGIVLLFGLFFGYFIIFELWWSGRTPGKRALGIRVVRDAGFPIDVGAAVTRNLVRILEFGAGFYAVSAIAALLSRQNKRLGDVAAGTIVVRDAPADAGAIDAFLAREAPPDDGLTADERAWIERYVLRRAALDPAARVRLAAEMAERIRPNLRAAFDHLSDDELLIHLGRAAAGPR